MSGHPERPIPPSSAPPLGLLPWALGCTPLVGSSPTLLTRAGGWTQPRRTPAVATSSREPWKPSRSAHSPSPAVSKGVAQPRASPAVAHNQPHAFLPAHAAGHPGIQQQLLEGVLGLGSRGVVGSWPRLQAGAGVGHTCMCVWRKGEEGARLDRGKLDGVRCPSPTGRDERGTRRQGAAVSVASRRPRWICSWAGH